MAFKVDTVCSKCGKEAKPNKAGIIRMHLAPPICSDCKPFPPEVEEVEVPKEEWDALVLFLETQEKTYKDSFNTPGKNNWKQYLKVSNPEEYKIYEAARRAADRKF